MRLEDREEAAPWRYLLEWFPGFDYRQPVNPNLLDMRKPNNIVGHWQRVVTTLWALKQFRATGGVPGIEFGSAGVQTPGCLSTDVRTGLRSHYPPKVPVGERAIVGGQLRVAADYFGEKFSRLDPVCGDTATVYGLGIFPDAAFGFIAANHVFEHLDDCPEVLLGAWRRILRPGGIVALVMPDARWFDAMKSDPDHRHCYDGRDFEKIVSKIPGYKILEHTAETQINYHSYATILEAV